MKKFSLLILSVLLLSCSSDDDTNEGNFLEANNGVVWKSPKASGNPPDYGHWTVFTPESFFGAEYSNKYGCFSETYKWGVASSEGVIYTVQENSENKLVLKYKEPGVTDEIYTYTTSNDGKVLIFTYTGKDDSIENKAEITVKLDRVTLSATDPC